MLTPYIFIESWEIILFLSWIIKGCSILTSYIFWTIDNPQLTTWYFLGIRTRDQPMNGGPDCGPCCLGNKPRFGNIYMTRFVLGVDPETFKCKCPLPNSQKNCRLKHIVPGFTSTMLVQQQETAWHQPVWCCLHGCRWDRSGHLLEVNVRPLGIVGSDVSQASLIWRALARSQSPFICTALVFFCAWLTWLFFII